MSRSEKIRSSKSKAHHIPEAHNRPIQAAEYLEHTSPSVLSFTQRVLWSLGLALAVILPIALKDAPDWRRVITFGVIIPTCFFFIWLGFRPSKGIRADETEQAFDTTNAKNQAGQPTHSLRRANNWFIAMMLVVLFTTPLTLGLVPLPTTLSIGWWAVMVGMTAIATLGVFIGLTKYEQALQPLLPRDFLTEHPDFATTQPVDHVTAILGCVSAFYGAKEIRDDRLDEILREIFHDTDWSQSDSRAAIAQAMSQKMLRAKPERMTNGDLRNWLSLTATGREHITALRDAAPALPK